jgi:glutamate-1-semialdehyde aminotransferase
MRCGYHGWHDWCVEVKGGIPSKLYEDIYEFHYNDLEALEQLLREHGSDTAAIIVTPYGHPLSEPMQDPAPGFLEGMRKLADQYGAVLIFDEIRTGFRLALGGAQQYYGITPDLATFGKAMANGYAISAICGKADIMKRGERDVFISSTFFPNSDGYVAALKTIEILERERVLDVIWQKGEVFLAEIRSTLEKYSELQPRLSGIAPMFFITFERDAGKKYKQRRTEFYTQLIRRGIFLQPFHHGYVCYRHTTEQLNHTIKAIDAALYAVKQKIG